VLQGGFESSRVDADRVPQHGVDRLAAPERVEQRADAARASASSRPPKPGASRASGIHSPLPA